MAKKRVHELAREYKSDNKEFLTKLQQLGFDVASHASTVDEDEVEAKLKGPSADNKTETVKVKIKPGVIRRRTQTVTRPEAEVSEEIASLSPQESVEEPLLDQKASAQIKPTFPDTNTQDVKSEQPVVQANETQVLQEIITSEAHYADKPIESDHSNIVAHDVPEITSSEPTKEIVSHTLPAPSEIPIAAPTRPMNRPTPISTVLGRIDLRGVDPRFIDQGNRNASHDNSTHSSDAKTSSHETPGELDPAKVMKTLTEKREFRIVAPRSYEHELELELEGKAKGLKKTKLASKKTDRAVDDEWKIEKGRVFYPTNEEVGVSKRKKLLNKKAGGHKPLITTPKAIKRVVEINNSIQVGELAKQMHIKVGDLIKKLMEQNVMVTINQSIDYDTATLIAQDFAFETQNVAFNEEHIITKATDENRASEPSAEIRPPIVTVMGHVDHGKTSLLDYIRKSDVAAHEHGGITQHIGAYQVEHNGSKITFLDTPGHEAFTQMRARGAAVTDIVILVVAADDGVMPQTIEALNHAKAAQVPIIVAVNKIDLPGANSDKIMQTLSQNGLLPEEWGGDTIFSKVSAKTGAGVPELLDMILLQSEVLELKASLSGDARAFVVESRLDKGQGNLATVIVTSGSLTVGNFFVCGEGFGRIKRIFDDKGKTADQLFTSQPGEIIGLNTLPNAGDELIVLKSEKDAKTIAEHRALAKKEKQLAATKKISLEDIFQQIENSGQQKLSLKLVIKGDVHGSIEALSESLKKLSNDVVAIEIIHSAVGGISEGDVMLAAASNGIILGFNIRPETKALKLAESEGVEIKSYNIIYEAINDIKAAMQGLLKPTVKEEYLGRAEVRQLFQVAKVGVVAGCFVVHGKMTRGAQVRLLRDGVVLYTGKLNSLKRFKEDVREVVSGYECGMGVENYNDLKIGDIIEGFELKEIQTTMEKALADKQAQLQATAQSIATVSQAKSQKPNETSLST